MVVQMYRGCFLSPNFLDELPEKPFMRVKQIAFRKLRPFRQLYKRKNPDSRCRDLYFYFSLFQ